MKYLKLYEEFSDKNIIDFCQDKEHLVKNTKFKKFIYHATRVNPKDFFIDDDYNASEQEGNGAYSLDIPDGYLFLSDDIKELQQYGRYIIPCEIETQYYKCVKFKNCNNPSILFDEDYNGYTNFGLYDKLEESGFLEIRCDTKSTFIAYTNIIRPRIDLAMEFYNIK